MASIYSKKVVNTSITAISISAKRTERSGKSEIQCRISTSKKGVVNTSITAISISAKRNEFLERSGKLEIQCRISTKKGDCAIRNFELLVFLILVGFTVTHLRVL